jgi:cell division septal protein FtsQ
MQDMRPKPRPAAKPEPARPASTRSVTIARGKKKQAEPRVPLKKRRKKAKKALVIVLGILAVLLFAGALYAIWLPMFRADQVVASGPHAEEAKAIAESALHGTHAFIVPRDSLFFIPESAIRARILEAYPDVEAISITADGLDTLRITLLPRAEAFLWCGAAYGDPSARCYSANAEGLVFAELPPDAATSTEALRIYAPVEGGDGVSPVKGRITGALHIPEVLRMVKAMQSLGADVAAAAMRGDEADLYTDAGTRLTYVLGREEEAAGIAASVFPQLSLNDGSIAYVDLRFPGKAYFKRTDTGVPEGE